MNKTAQLYYQSARALKLPTLLINQIAGFKIKLGSQHYFFRGGDTPFNNESSMRIADNKYCTNKLLKASGFPTPKAHAFGRDRFKHEKIESLIEDLKFPLVVKPMSGTALGTDVLCNINTITQLSAYMKSCYQTYPFLSVEEFHGGLNSYRVLIFYNQIIGVIQRFPASVVGDGVHSIKTLIAMNNVTREILKNSISLEPIKIDQEMKIRLKELNMTLDTIPKEMESITLCYTCNSSRGGTVKSLGKSICVENSKLLCRAAKVLGLNLVGFDVLCEDILIPFEASGGMIIEANSNPDMSIHENPMMGPKNQVCKKIVRRLLLRHPLAYLFTLSQNKSNHLYFKSSLVFFILLAYNFLSM